MAVRFIHSVCHFNPELFFTQAFGILSPLNPLRRAALFLLVNPWFNLIIFFTILLNCLTMTQTEKGFQLTVVPNKEFVLDNTTFFIVTRFPK